MGIAGDYLVIEFIDKKDYDGTSENSKTAEGAVRQTRPDRYIYLFHLGDEETDRILSRQPIAKVWVLCGENKAELEDVEVEILQMYVCGEHKDYFLIEYIEKE